MDIRQAGMLAVAIPIAIAVASVVMWAGCRWWYGRKLAAAAHRLQKSEKGRLFSQQQTVQARQQIGILKAELEVHQQADGSVHVPLALRPYLGGRSELKPT